MSEIELRIVNRPRLYLSPADGKMYAMASGERENVLQIQRIKTYPNGMVTEEGGWTDVPVVRE